MLLFSAAFGADIYSVPSEKASTLTGIATISERQLHAESSDGKGMWNYFEILPTQTGKPPSLEELKAAASLGTCNILDVGIFDYSMIDRQKTVNETEVNDSKTQKTVSYKELSIGAKAGMKQDGKKQLFGVKTPFGQACHFNPDITGCGTLASAGTYDLTGNLSSPGATCLQVGADNITIDCHGYSIIGDNTAATRGITSNQANTTIKDCKVSGFYNGIYLDNADNAKVQNNTIISKDYAGMFFNAGTTGAIVSNNAFANSTYAQVIYTTGAAIDNLTFANNTYFNMTTGWFYTVAASSTNITYMNETALNRLTSPGTLSAGKFTIQNSNITINGIVSSNAGTSYINNIFDTTLPLRFSAGGATITGNNITSAESNNGAIYTEGTAWSNVSNNRITSVRGVYIAGSNGYFSYNNITASDIAVFFGSGSASNNTFYRNNLTCSGTSYGVVLYLTGAGGNFTENLLNETGNQDHIGSYVTSTAANSIFYNNTFVGGSATKYAAALTAQATNINFTANNFSTVGKWISNLGTGNNFNDSTTGNIYYFTNGSNTWQYQSWTGNPWATGGSLLPVNSTNFATYWAGAGEDWHPYNGAAAPPAGNQSNLTVLCGTGGASCITNASNFDVPANKTINATAQTDYTFSNWSITAGACTINNSLANNTFTIFGAASTNCTVQANFNYTPPTYTPPNITACLILNLTNGTAYYNGSALLGWANATDGDNATFYINYTWWMNGSINSTGQYPNYNNNTLENIATITAESTFVGQNWTLTCQAWDGLNYSAAVNSTNATVQETAAPPPAQPPPSITSTISFTDSGTAHSFTMTAAAANVSSWLATFTEGTCTNQSNSTAGANITTVVFSCTDTNLTGVFNITFTNAAGSNYTNASHTYPNHAPSVTAPTITPSPALFNSTLTCNAGVFSDPDGDTNSTPSWAWYLNGSLIGGATNNTLTNSSFNVSDLIKCQQTPIDQYLLAGLPVNSSQVTISNGTETVTLNITYPAVSPYTVYFQTFVIAYANATDTAGAGIRTITCNRSDQFNGFEATLAQEYVSGVPLKFNFTVAANNSGNEQTISCQACTAGICSAIDSTVIIPVGISLAESMESAASGKDYYLLGIFITGIGLVYIGIKLIYVSFKAYTPRREG